MLGLNEKRDAIRELAEVGLLTNVPYKGLYACSVTARDLEDACRYVATLRMLHVVVAKRLHEQFVQQQHAADISQFDVERDLRNDKESFNTVRTLSPETYRFRVVDAQGQDVHNRSDAVISDNGTRSTFGLDDYTRVYCGEPVPDRCHDRIRDRHAPPFTSEVPAYYAVNARWVPDTPYH